ncbi:unnamed protein product [Spodoptera exigua]|nr:unnamed protein product [Spodoptera exigua]
MAWASPNAILELSEKLLYDAHYQTPFFNDYDWYLVPMGNPDGIEFTHKIRTRAPLDSADWAQNISVRAATRPSEWHKNVDLEDEQKDTRCFGTNINRNFAYHWQDDVHKTPTQCCQYYPGQKPFSTAEARAIRKYVDKMGDFINLAIHLHASFKPKKVHQSSNDERVAGTLIDYISGVVGVDLVFLIKPYHEMFPNFTDTNNLRLYVKKSITTVLSLVRAWRSSTRQNTLSFFGRDVEF